MAVSPISFVGDSKPVTRKQLVQILAALHTDSVNSPAAFIRQDSNGNPIPGQAIVGQLINLLTGALDD